MKITLHTEGWYDAAHHLNNYEGKCSNMHGHTYKVEVWVRGDEKQLDKAGILWDFGKLKDAIDLFDHSNLNEVYDEGKLNSTAENQCVHIYNYLKRIDKKLNFKVRLYEQLEPKRSYAECGDFE